MKIRRFQLILSLCLAACFLLLGGCGGSTRGSGGVTTVKGAIFDPNGVPQGGVTVTILETGDMTTSQPDGGFEVAGASPSEGTQSFTLLFEDDSGLSSQAAVRDITRDTLEVVTTVILDRVQQVVQIVEEDRRVRPASDGNNERPNGDGGEGIENGEREPTGGGGEREPSDGSIDGETRPEDGSDPERDPSRPRPDEEGEEGTQRDPNRHDPEIGEATLEENGDTESSPAMALQSGAVRAGGAA